MFDLSNYSPVLTAGNKLQNKRSKMQSTAYQQELDRTRSFKSQLLKLESIVNKPGDTAQINQVFFLRFQPAFVINNYLL